MLGKSSVKVAIEYMKNRIKELDEEIYGEGGMMESFPLTFDSRYVEAQTELDTLRRILGKLEES
jgi:hypothetical protein